MNEDEQWTFGRLMVENCRLRRLRDYEPRAAKGLLLVCAAAIEADLVISRSDAELTAEALRCCARYCDDWDQALAVVQAELPAALRQRDGSPRLPGWLLDVYPELGR